MNDPLDTFARRLLDDLDVLVALITDRLVQQLPGWQDQPADVCIEMLDWVHRICSAALELVVKGEPLDPLGPMIEEMARRRRGQGIDRMRTLQAYELGQQAVLDALGEQVHGDPKEASLFPQLTRRLLEFQRVTTLWVTAGYSSPQPLNRDRDADVQALLEIRAGRSLAVGDDHDLGRRLGISLPLKEVTVSSDLGAALPKTVRDTARVNPRGVIGALDGRMVALTLRPPHDFPEPSGTATLPDLADPPVVEAAIRAAAQAADVAVVLGTARLSATEAAPLSALLTVPDTAREAYVESCFRSLPRTARGRALLTAVSAALTYGRSGEAARALHVHRHTLDYRLGRFAAETGLDLSDPATRFRCTIGLFLIGLMPHRTEPGVLQSPADH